uniref:Uncharacterized protein n=1 Tax=Guillardia theta (strain CCMP2712) TaxID=905079 RepID=A0A0C3SR79_GUITC
MGSEFSKNAWLQTGDNSGKAWWEHKATPGHHAILSAIPNLNGAIHVDRAPGWSSLLPQTKNGVDAGLQCPMCSTGSASNQSY